MGLTAREWAAIAGDRNRFVWRLKARVRRLKAQLRDANAGVPAWPWGALAACEAGRRWAYNGPSGFDGSLQFAPSTWSSHRLDGYPTFAYQATPFQQVVVGETLRSKAGWNPWPACSRKLGLR